MKEPDTTTRSLTLDDLTEIQRLWQTAATHEPVNEDTLREKIFDDRSVSSGLRLGTFAGDELIGLAVGCQRTDRSYIKLIAVAPRYQLQHHATRLLQQIESTLTRSPVQEIRVAESAPNYLTPGVDIRNTAAIGFFRSHGYEDFGQALNQHVVLSGSDWDTSLPEKELAANQGIRIERLESSALPSLRELLGALWPAWGGEVDVAISNMPPTIFVGRNRQDAVIAFAAHDANNQGTGWFGPMGTHPDYEGRGIGRLLLWRCLQEMKGRGYELATIPWVGPTAFYEKHADATISQRFLRMKKTIHHEP